MDVQIISDVHLEASKGYDLFDIVPKAPYLVLLGDIGYVVAHRNDFFEFLRRQLRLFKAVLLVPGNHEAYESNWPETIKALRAFETEIRNDSAVGDFVLLDRTTFHIPGAKSVIIGCSLFSHIPENSMMDVEMRLNDFYKTGKEWTVATHNAMHSRDVAWLNTQVTELAESDAKIMICSHWSPSQDPRTMDPRHLGSPITSAFSTDMSSQPCFRSPKVKVWAFGHTHYNCDLHIDRNYETSPLRLVTNQRGYYFDQAAGYEDGKIVSI